MTGPIRCDRCPAKTLGYRFADGTWEVRHKGRAVGGTGVIKIKCEDCGNVTCSLDSFARVAV